MYDSADTTLDELCIFLFRKNCIWNRVKKKIQQAPEVWQRRKELNAAKSEISLNQEVFERNWRSMFSSHVWRTFFENCVRLS